MRIQELEQLVNADRATIRYYEKEGLIVPMRSENGYRDYTTENVQELKRIILLRQLGVSVYTIQQLQKGSTDFRDVLERQVETLTEQIAAQKRARIICEALRDDGTEYSALDAEYYIKMMERIRIDEETAGEKSFQEHLPKEIHPWRRWFARTIDYALIGAIIQFILIVIFRIRPLPEEVMDSIILIAAALLFVPLEAYLLSKWGTTPGKYAMGIRLESIQGGSMCFREALARSWMVLRDGMCFCIPYLKIWCNLRRYLQLTGRTFHRFASRADIPEREEMPWDEDTEILYTSHSRKRGVVLGIILAALVLLTMVTAMDSIKPKYRGNELTLEQFVENYNHCLSLINPNAESFSKLQPDGTYYPVPEDVYIVNINGGNKHYPDDFLYEMDGNYIKSITIQQKWTDCSFINPMGKKCACLAFTAMLSQKGTSVRDLYRLSERMDSLANSESGTVSYGDVAITWYVESENYHCVDGTYWILDQEKPASLEFEFKIIFH